MNSYDPNDNIVEKINTFKALVENFDDDVALKYLEKSGWDETKAAQLYYDDQSESLARNLHSNEMRPSQNHPRINANNNFNYYNEVGISEQLLQNEARSSYNVPQQEPRREERGFFIKLIMAPIEWISSLFCEKGRGHNSNEPSFITKLPGHVNDFESYGNGMKRKLGLLFVYNENDIEFLGRFVNRILSLDFLTEILRENCVIYSTPLSSEQGKAIKSMILSENRGSGFLSPAIFFTFDPHNNAFRRSCVLDTLQGESMDVEIFQEFLIRNIEKKEDILHGRRNVSNIANTNQSANLNRDESTGLMGNAEILEQQRRDMERILREEERKKKMKEEEEKRIQRENEEKLQKEKMMEMNKKSKKERKREGLPAEPEEGNPNAALIGLRCPHDGNILKRRFLKTEKIQVLYDLVESLEEKIFEESEEFDIIQTFPFKVFSDKNKTLEEEKLFPNAILQIREKELD